MAKCYVFSIGGTGSRVLRSMIMMLSCGMKLEMQKIVPIIIDPDMANADLTRTVKLGRLYNEIRKNISGGSQGGFFAPEIVKQDRGNILDILNTSDITFSRFMGVSSMSRESQALVKMLFSQKNLGSSMKVGFKGNPNIGSVVLNQITDSRQFADFANTFEEGDKIFIISSIFGGTGASGFPLLLKTLRTGNTFPNWSLINKAEIGAESVLPYFRVRSSEESEIDSSSFVSKTMAALAYYEENIYNAHLINALYFIGDDLANIYENNEGGVAQQNEAHIIEFLSATAFVDFVNRYYDGTNCLELGIKDILSEVTFDKLYPVLAGELEHPLTRMLLTAECLRSRYEFLASPQFNANRTLHIPQDFYQSKFIRSLREFTTLYQEWLHELKDNVRSLSLFHNIEGEKHPFDIIDNSSEKRTLSFKSDYYFFYDRLNRAARHVSGIRDVNLETRFLMMFFNATEKLTREKIVF